MVVAVEEQEQQRYPIEGVTQLIALLRLLNGLLMGASCCWRGLLLDLLPLRYVLLQNGSLGK